MCSCSQLACILTGCYAPTPIPPYLELLHCLFSRKLISVYNIFTLRSPSHTERWSEIKLQPPSSQQFKDGGKNLENKQDLSGRTEEANSEWAKKVSASHHAHFAFSYCSDITITRDDAGHLLGVSLIE